MPLNATQAAMIQCTFGAAPSTLNALPITRVMIEGKPAAVTTDTAPMVNIPPFGMCMSLANPIVAAATTAALGVLTPMPCVPAIVGTWVPGAVRTLVAGTPALTMGSQCMCAWGGAIAMIMPGAVRTQSG